MQVWLSQRKMNNGQLVYKRMLYLSSGSNTHWEHKVILISPSGGPLIIIIGVGSAGEGVGENLHLCGGKVNSYSHQEKQDRVLKSKITVSFTKLTSGLISKRNGSRPLKSHLNSHVHCTAIRDSHGAETSCVHYVKNVQREWDTHKEQCCSGTKNARLSKVTKRVALEMLLFCDMRKAQKDNYCMTSIIWGMVKLISLGLKVKWWLPEAGESGRADG